MTSRNRLLIALVVVIGVGAAVSYLAGLSTLALCLAITLAALRPWIMMREAMESRRTVVHPRVRTDPER